MRPRILCLSLIVSILIFGATSSHTNSNDRLLLPFQKTFDQPHATLVNINQISMWVQANGLLCQSPYTDLNWGLFYPRGTAGVVYADGIIWGGFVKDGHEPELRVGGQRWTAGTVPGAILSEGVAEDPDSPDVRVWRIRRDWQTADLTRETAELYDVSPGNVTAEQIAAVRSQYEKDWKEWPWQKGAPFYDNNKNGVMDANEEPGLAHADQVVWFVANDLDSSVTKSFFRKWVNSDEWIPNGSPPIGLEMQVTLWAYNGSGTQLNEAFQHMVFKRVRLIYKGRSDTPDSAHIDSMFISQFVDTDVGDYTDDYAGCDTMLQLGYGYNSVSNDQEYYKFDLPAPAIGYTAIQGPIIPGTDPADKGNFDFREIEGFKNLEMTSFWQKSTGSAWSTPQNSLTMYNLMNGYLTGGDGSIIPLWDCNENPTKFMVSGDPVEGIGCIDGMPHVHPGIPGDRRFQMNFGPFSMALGDTQEVIMATVGGSGSDCLASVSVMKHYVKWARFHARSVFESGLESTTGVLSADEFIPHEFRLYQNYPNPFKANTEIHYALPLQRDVRLTVYNLLGQEIKVLINKTQNPNSYAVRWDGTDAHGNKVPAGLYFYVMKAGQFIQIKKMMLLH